MRAAKHVCPPAEWASEAERIVWHLDNSDGGDRRFRREIFQQWPNKIAEAVAKTYRVRYETQGQREANLWLLDMQDKFKPSSMALAWNDDELVAEAERASKRCREALGLYRGSINEALRMLVGICNRYGLDAAPVTDTDTVTEKEPCIRVGQTTHTVTGFIRRVTDRDSRWWRRQLRSRHGRDIEAAAIQVGLVKAQAGIYASDETLKRKRQQSRRNRRILESMQAVNDSGYCQSLAELSDVTVSNPRNRRAELMTRARGFEEIAKSLGHAAEFYTVTCPSTADEDRVSISYIERLEKLPTLHTQGDGMRSFAGVLLATSVGRESIMLIDEPEAFLHPPQARLLGTTLVQDRNKERQLFIATHSADIVRGVLDAESPEVRVIRIRRSGSTNTVRLLSNERIKELWGDPLLRYSNILDGLFHESVVVCEADADCRFYAAILDAAMAGKTDDVRRPDLMFTHCGGKARLPVVIRALREVDVPVRAVADFDVLSEEEPLKSIVESLGVDWSEIQADWRIVKTAVDSKKPDLNTDDVKKEIGELLSAVTTTTFPPKAKAGIQTLLKRSSPWAHAKLVGKAFVPSGDPSKACERLLSKLRAGGLHVVEVGELEGYVRTEGGHGPKWVNAVLTRELALDPELETARKFVLELAT